MSKSRQRKRNRRLNKKRFFIVLILFLQLGIIIYQLFNSNIKNIYISGNRFLTDQEIIDISGLKNYPKTINNLSFNIKNKLEKNKYVLYAKVTKKNFFTSVHIDLKENYPLFYYQVEGNTILFDGSVDSKIFSVPTVINQIPDTVYDKFLKNMKNVDVDILDRISEIEYLPNDVDQERFLLIMNDGNYVYLTLRKYLTINKYIDMVKSFNNKKGILYLDSGEYFDIFD